MKDNLLWIILLIPLLVVGNPAISLFVGAAVVLFTGMPSPRGATEISNYSLQAAIILLGFKFGFEEIKEITENKSIIVAIYVLLAMLVGTCLGWLINKDRTSSQLITHGTAVCGGTTIISLSTIIKATPEQTGITLALVFCLNAIALFTFPLVGQTLDLSQEQFGLWAALAIHDTSSVIATSSLYGEKALAVATTTKLVRTLWLIPLLLIFSIYRGVTDKKISIPWFILLFFFAAACNSLLSFSHLLLDTVSLISKSLIVLALFFIGTSATRESLQNLTGSMAAQALLLWGVVVTSTLYWVYYFS